VAWVPRMILSWIDASAAGVVFNVIRILLSVFVVVGAAPLLGWPLLLEKHIAGYAFVYRCRQPFWGAH
jgi:hypothetical protein